MIDKAKRMKEAGAFQGENDCYIHTEMKNGKGCATVLAGGGVAILHGICGEITRVSQISGATFEETLKAIRELHGTATAGNITINRGNKQC